MVSFLVDSLADRMNIYDKTTIKTQCKQ